MSDTATLLSNVPLFALLDDQERAVLAQRVELVERKAGELLFKQNELGGSLYVVAEGEVEMFVTTHTGDKLVVDLATPGHFFGEISLLDGGVRTASAVVKADSKMLVIDREDIEELLKLKPAAAMDIVTAIGRRLRDTNKLLRDAATRNINEEQEDRRSRAERVVDWVADFSGSLPFLYMHIVFFAIWIVANVPPLEQTWVGGFDPFPFGLLTMCVSLEAIMLSVMLLLSQNRSAARDRVRNDIEYKVNLKAELEVAQLHEKVDHMHAELMARLERLQSSGAAPQQVGLMQKP
jgi:CRP/FNR family transcriptional regulator, cyclic AMP receptor protein